MRPTGLFAKSTDNRASKDLTQALAAEGANLVLFARNAEQLASTGEEIASRYGVDVSHVAGDMQSRGDVNRLRDVIRGSGGLDILILNSPRPPMPMRNVLDEMDDSRWDVAYSGVLQSAIWLTREIVPILVERGWGRVVAITSASVRQPLPHHALSSVYRTGLTALLKHLANEVAASGVTVNSVAPAVVLTDGFRRDWNLDERRRGIPMGRFGTAAEFAALVTFLASDRAGFTTGATVPIDGGLTGNLF